MKQLNIVLENCHGIRTLTTSLRFKRNNAVAIYAPNGMMKTSFARAFADIANEVESTDQMFPERQTVRSVVDENGDDLSAQNVVVIVSYDEQMGPTEATSTLLVDHSLRTEFEGLQTTIEEAKAELVKALKATTRSRKDIATAVSLAFTADDESFFTALLRIEEELKDEKGAFADVPYDTIFDDKVTVLLATPAFQSSLAEYVARFNELLDASDYFDRHTFNYYNASTVSKSLGDNGYFKANHALVLNRDAGSEQVASQEELTEMIETEKTRISEDAALRKTFTSLEKQLTKNAETRRFYDYISDHSELLPELKNVKRFNERVWKSYIKQNEPLYNEAVRRFRKADTRKREIMTLAAAQRSQWEEVIDIFNNRFFVPFTLTVKNRTKVMLGQESVAQLGFEFKDGSDRAVVERSELLEVLSTGEKKALYILNVLFEVERRKSSSTDTLFVVDDIADSFDYKNKYAIIQYLKDIAEEKNFRLVTLTHNFDFYRTLESRFVPYSQCLMAQRNDEGVTLVEAEGIKNPFINDFKPKFFTDDLKRIASIPFMRNLLEYMRGVNDPDYATLTALLHWKAQTASISQHQLDEIFSRLFGDGGAWPASDAPVIKAINEEADNCLAADTSINFANKIVMSIAIRLTAEKFMVESIDDTDFIAGLDANQTSKLFGRFRREHPYQTDAIRTLESVVLMTPEQIHINSFMYEPILDMSDDHLRRLLTDVRNL